MSLSLGSVVNTAANISSRKTDKGKAQESSLYEFLNSISHRGVQVKSNFEVEFLEMEGLQFFCQNISFPGLKTNNTELSYKCRTVQIPINCEQEHDFQMTIINDANGNIYNTIRGLVIHDYQDGLVQAGVYDTRVTRRRYLDTGHKLTIKARGDGSNYAGMNVIMDGVRFTHVSGMDYSHQDSTVQTFTVDGYVNFVDFETGNIKKKDGLLGKIDKVSNKISNILGK